MDSLCKCFFFISKVVESSPLGLCTCIITQWGWTGGTRRKTHFWPEGDFRKILRTAFHLSEPGFIRSCSITRPVCTSSVHTPRAFNTARPCSLWKQILSPIAGCCCILQMPTKYHRRPLSDIWRNGPITMCETVLIITPKTLTALIRTVVLMLLESCGNWCVNMIGTIVLAWE